MPREIEIVQADDGAYWYVFEDMVGRFWPGDEGFDYNNHDVKDRIMAEVRQRYGEQAIINELEVALPYTSGHVHFDCEAGMFQCHADEREPVAAMVSFINDMLAARALKREALS